MVSNKIEICGGNDNHKEVMEQSPTHCNSSFTVKRELIFGDNKICINLILSKTQIALGGRDCDIIQHYTGMINFVIVYFLLFLPYVYQCVQMSLYMFDESKYELFSFNCCS